VNKRDDSSSTNNRKSVPELCVSDKNYALYGEFCIVPQRCVGNKEANGSDLEKCEGMGSDEKKRWK